MDRHRYITRSRRAFVRIKKASKQKARAASSLSGFRLKKVDGKNSMVAVFRSMARGLTISVSRDKIGKPPSPPVDITAACSIISVSRSRGPWRANVRILLIRTNALMSARDLERKIISGRGRVVHGRKRRFTGSFHFSACRRCRDLVCGTATHG